MSEIVDALVDGMADAQHRAREHGRDARHARMRAAVLARTAAPQAAARPGWVWPSTIAALAIAVVVLWVGVRPQPLTFEVRPGGTIDGAQAFVTAANDPPTLLQFSDGSAVEVKPATRMRVTAVQDGAAEVALDGGALEMRLSPEGGGSWIVLAGPYRIAMTGAALDVAWDPDDGRLTLALGRGTAHVEGPGIDDDVGIGEPLVFVHDATPQAVAAAEPSALPPPLPEAPTEIREPSPSKRGVGKRPAAPRALATDDWRSLARRGDHEAALAAAESAGFAGLCATLDADALLELADTARYAGRTARAREALQALRRRFDGTQAAATAAFDLGRLEGTRKSACVEATRWFRTYLREQPGGAMAEAARTRVSECTEQEPAANP